MSKPSLPVTGVVNVTVDMAPKAAQLRSFGACLIIGASDVIDINERIRSYSSIEDVAQDFGTSAAEYAAATVFLGQSPKPSEIQIGRWAMSPTSGLARGRILSTDEQALTKFTGVTSGAFDVTIDGQKVSITELSLEGSASLDAVASKVTDKLNSKGTCSWDGARFVIKSVSTGKASKVASITSTEATKALGLDSGVVSVDGIDKESLADAISEFLDFQSWYMAYVAAPHEDEDVKAAAAIIEAANPSRIIGFTVQDTQEIDPTQKDDTLGAALKALGYNRTMLMYSSTEPQACASIMGRMSTVNFEGSNTTITLKFKQAPGVASENLRSSQAAVLSGNNVNVFAAYQNDTSILQEGTMSSGWFIDEVHGLDWLQNYIQTGLWNLLYTTSKVGQDDAGIEMIRAKVCSLLDQGVRNHLIAPGVWNGNEFGSLKQGDTLSSGYYVYIQPLNEQSQVDREARKAPPIQIAVKLAGAIHFIDVAITVNR